MTVRIRAILLAVEAAISTHCRPRFSRVKLEEASKTLAIPQVFRSAVEPTPSPQINLFPQEVLWEFAELADPRTCTPTLLQQWEEEWEPQFLSEQLLTDPHKTKALIPFIRQDLGDNLSEAKALEDHPSEVKALVANLSEARALEVEDLCGLKEVSRTTLRIISSCHSR